MASWPGGRHGAIVVRERPRYIREFMWPARNGGWVERHWHGTKPRRVSYVLYTSAGRPSDWVKTADEAAAWRKR